jgi:signal transduction histidine kinase
MTWSSELFRIVGIESDTVELDFDRFLEAVHSEDRDRVAAAFRESSTSQDVRTLNHRIVTPQNQTKFVTERWQVATGVDGQSLVAIGTCQDITERMTLEDRVRQSERLEALGQLTGGVAHDFNNLLTVILGNAETLGESLERQRDLQLLAEMTAAAAERGAELTKRLLAFARRQDLAPQTIDLNAQVVGMERLLRRTLPENIGINVQLGDPLGRALIDPGQLEVAVLNLALNARDAMPDGGRLTLQTANVVLDDAYAGAVSEVVSGPYVMLAITDNGVGMNQVTLDRAFEPFFTTKEVGKGSGLGLSMVYGFIKQSNGHVEIHSELGHGTSAKLYLPQAKADAPQPISKPTASPLPTGSEVVLLVEDDGLVRNYAATQLRSLGYQVVAAVDGLEAMRILASRSDIALLFTDYIMPNGMNGGQLAENARRLRPDLPVLFTSGYSEGAIDSAIGAQLLRKPYRRQELALKIRHALDDRPIRH